MTPLKEIGECLITVDGEEYFFRPSFANMTRIGEPQEIVQAFYDLHHNELADLLVRAVQSYGQVPHWLVDYVKRTSYGRRAYIAAVVVLNACCERDAELLTGFFQPAKGNGRTFKVRSGALPVSDILLIAQDLITHGVIGKAKVRRLQRHENGQTSPEFRSVDYIVAAQTHFGMGEEEARNLTMTKFQMLLSSKYPDQKGFTKEEYDAVTEKYLARQEARRARAKA